MDFNKALSTLDKSSRPKLIKEILNFNEEIKK